MRNAAKQSSRGFGYQEHQSLGYRFEVRPRSNGGIVIVEQLSNRDDPESTYSGAPREKAELNVHRWGLVQQPVAAEFNQRLRQEGLRAGRWLKSATPLAPYFGKELVLLAWAIDDQDPTLIPRMLANWRGLAPEERWWFYTTINASMRIRPQNDKHGWKAAIKIAFLDEPRDMGLESLRAFEQPDETRKINRADEDDGPKTKKQPKQAQQGRLFAEPDAPEYDAGGNQEPTAAAAAERPASPGDSSTSSE